MSYGVGAVARCQTRVSEHALPFLRSLVSSPEISLLFSFFSFSFSIDWTQCLCGKNPTRGRTESYALTVSYYSFTMRIKLVDTCTFVCCLCITNSVFKHLANDLGRFLPRVFYTPRRVDSSQSIFHIPPLPLLSHYLSRFTSIVHLAKHCNKKFSLPSNPVSHRHALLCRLGRSHGS